MPHSTLAQDKTPTAFALLSGRNLAFFLIAITLYRILSLMQPHVSLFYDEAYYYHWSLNLDWGYYSKPPMVAWVIALFTNLFGHSGVAVKMGAPILYSATAGILFFIGRRLWSTAAGVTAACVFSSVLLVGFNSLFITTDAPLLFFWALSTYLFIRAVDSNHWQDWVLLGVSVGLGMLSKYTMGALPMGLFIFMALSPSHRPLLFTAKPWAAALLAGLIFSPNIYWNYLHDFVTLSHTSDISQLDRQLFHPDKLAEFVFSQLLVYGPIWSYFLLRQWFNKQARSSLAHRGLLLAIFLPLFLVISTQALLSRAFINWAAPCIIGVALSVGYFLSQHPKKLLVGLAVQLLLVSIFYHWPFILNGLGIEPTRKNNVYQRTEGWPQLAQQVAPILKSNPDALLTSPSRKLLAYVGFYGDNGNLRVARWNSNSDRIDDYYDLFFNLRAYENQPQQAFIVIDNIPVVPERLARFDSCSGATHFTQPVFKDLTREIYLYICRGFKGY